jgi:sRNA-binding protein
MQDQGFVEMRLREQSLTQERDGKLVIERSKAATSERVKASKKLKKGDAVFVFVGKTRVRKTVLEIDSRGNVVVSLRSGVTRLFNPKVVELVSE